MRGVALSRGTASLVGAVLASAVFMLVASDSSAVTRSASVAFTTTGEIESVTAHCPRGTRATGGGFKATPPSPNPYSHLKIFVWRKVRQRAWKVSAQEDAFFDTDMTLTSYVYCSPNAPRTHAVAHVEQLPQPHPTDFTPSVARCDSGKAQAGGFAIPTPSYDGDLIDSLLWSPRSWRTRVDADYLDSFKSIVYCSHRAAPIYRDGHDDEIGTDYGTALSPRCPRGTRPLAGGFGQPDAITGFAGNSYRNFSVYESRRSHRRWRTSGKHGGMTTSRLVSEIYCG